MSAEVETEPRTIWLIGGAVSLCTVAATNFLTTFVDLLFLLVPGSGGGPDNFLTYVRVIFQSSWPYFLLQIAVAIAAGLYVLKSHRESPQFTWGPVVQRALIFLLPAIVVVATLTFVLSKLIYNDGDTYRF